MTNKFLGDKTFWRLYQLIVFGRYNTIFMTLLSIWMRYIPLDIGNSKTSLSALCLKIIVPCELYMRMYLPSTLRRVIPLLDFCTAGVVSTLSIPVISVFTVTTHVAGIFPSLVYARTTVDPFPVAITIPSFVTVQTD